MPPHPKYFLLFLRKYHCQYDDLQRKRKVTATGPAPFLEAWQMQKRQSQPKQSRILLPLLTISLLMSHTEATIPLPRRNQLHRGKLHLNFELKL